MYFGHDLVSTGKHHFKPHVVSFAYLSLNKPNMPREILKF